MPKIRGRIIRVIDNRTVIINLGGADGIGSSSEFSILGAPETIIDPLTGEELGEVSVVKGKVRASQVHEKFTIASTKWRVVNLQHVQALSQIFTTRDVDQGELLVEGGDLKPWKAQTEQPVRVGDEVEVEVAAQPGEELEAERDTGQEVSEEPDELEGDSGDSTEGHA